MFAHLPAQNPGLAPGRLPSAGRPVVGPPLPIIGHLFSPIHGQCQQASKGTPDHSPAFAAGDSIRPIPGLTHKTPNATPYCALCADFLPGWPILESDKCGKCEDKERKAA